MHLTYAKRMSFPKSNLRSETLIPTTTRIKYNMTTQTILGISAGFHDAAVTVLKDDKILFASHSERYSKIKHDPHLCLPLMQTVMDYDPDVIAYYEKPILKKLRQLYAGQYSQAFYGGDLTIKRYLNSHFPALKLKNSIHYEHFSHHLSHAASSFQTSPFTKN